VTHDEAAPLLAAYATGALDDDVNPLEEHVAGCEECSAELALFRATTLRLAEAVPARELPARLRRSVLSAPAVRAASTRRRMHAFRSAAAYVLPLAALLILALGLAGRTYVLQRQIADNQIALATDERGLALLTSTETTVERLAAVPSLGDQAHGHWYHHAGIQTQVVVVEFMPPPGTGQAYFGWLVLQGGATVPVGEFTLDSTGYGRIILPGSDGSNVVSVIVTRQATSATAEPGGTVLHWP
jgi:hypothetical protein